MECSPTVLRSAYTVRGIYTNTVGVTSGRPRAFNERPYRVSAYIMRTFLNASRMREHMECSPTVLRECIHSAISLHKKVNQIFKKDT